VFPGFFGLLLYDALRARPRQLPVAITSATIAGAAGRIFPTGVALLLGAAPALLASHPRIRTKE
jgi:hypothetical protein